MIDPVLSLAFAMQSNKGVYALLLGSGISRSAGIPTGWEVVVDLVRKLAHLQSANCGADPAAWYAETYKAEADYDKILEVIAKSPAERSQLMRAYFEPTDDERGQGVKTPSRAHRAVAELVAHGYVRLGDEAGDPADGQRLSLSGRIWTSSFIRGAHLGSICRKRYKRKSPNSGQALSSPITGRR